MNTNEPKKINPQIPSSHVRFSEQEFSRIQKMQQLTGKSIPEILKTNTFSRTDLETPLMSKEEVSALLLELKRQGNNLNQLVRKLNSGLMQGWYENVNELVRGYFDIRHKLSVNLGNRKN